MSTLHTRGYRPAPGERVDAECLFVLGVRPVSPTRDSWTGEWRRARMALAPTDGPFGPAGRECLGARERFSQRHVGALTHVDIDQRINARGWDTWDTAVSVEPRPRWAIGLGVPR